MGASTLTGDGPVPKSDGVGVRASVWPGARPVRFVATSHLRLQIALRSRIDVPFTVPRGIALALLTVIVFPCLTGVGALQAQTQLQLPVVPADDYFIQDYAEILDSEVRREVGLVQEEAFRTYDTPIVVVTIRSKGEYGGREMEIEEFAARWFDHWEIGKISDEGELLNQGILLLVSVGDREARIELGADWGRRWDGRAEWIMDRSIVPEFQRGDYEAGVVAGAWGLLRMAEEGPAATPSRVPGQMLSSLRDRPFPTTPFPIVIIGFLFLLGLGSLVGAYFVPEHRKLLLAVGLGLMVAAFALWVLLALVVLFFGSRLTDQGGGGKGSGSSGGFRSGGGFGSGGFSGGGGATGRW